MRAFRSLLHFGAHQGRTVLTQETAGDEPPLRSELFSSKQMMRHGKALADYHKLSSGNASDRLLGRLIENEGILIEACNLLTQAVKAHHRVVPAGKWLIDNFYLIEEQIRMARRHLPKGYSRTNQKT